MQSHVHLLALLTDLVGECGSTKAQRKSKSKIPNNKWYWDDKHQTTFDEIKKTIARDVILAYPNFDEEFVIYNTDVSVHVNLVELLRKIIDPLHSSAESLR